MAPALKTFPVYLTYHDYRWCRALASYCPQLGEVVANDLGHNHLMHLMLPPLSTSALNKNATAFKELLTT